MNIYYKQKFILLNVGIIFILFLQGCHYYLSGTSFKDLEFIYQQVTLNHPGIHNKEHPNFAKNLNNSYQKHYKMLTNAKSRDEQKHVLQSFANSFDDSHVWISFTDHRNHLNHTTNNPSLFTIQRLNSTIAWITLPTFDLNEKQKSQFKLILNKLPTLRKQLAIIFDLRDNQGGNSKYGSQIIDSLFGEKYAQQQRAIMNAKVSVDWRISFDNIQHVRELYKRWRYPWLKDTLIGMEQGLQNNQPYYHAINAAIESGNKENYIPFNVQAKIIVIIDHSNVSAALDFIDELKMTKHQISLVGQTTRADRLYMEVRTVMLPSGNGTFSFPIKVYHNRLRADNVPYYPDFYYKDDISNTKTLKQFILQLLNDNLRLNN